MTDQRLREGLAVGYGGLWLALAVAPLDRGDWALENLLVVAFVAILWRTGAWLSLSRASFLCILAFLCLHAVGAHYTYSLVPYDRWAEALTGSTLNGMLGFERNHYDRLVHLAYGLLLTAPIREILPPTDRIGTAWRLFLPVAVVLSLSAAYEILEWAAAATLGGEIGIAYVGAQGDVWDAEKDMALATAGALLTSALAIVSERLRA
ncbi:membrane protein [Thalassobaculum fulvum]|uniref:Membrane protein n=1 Tax=Thalassobaculum fulvum TaxID=1633335 RepID=A0A918XSI9_9PROT|nr:DUF2238 domain-containing protein [Thalassobaculum fulvum]GHD52539.1 membrane protein [Thalassobaculum fulvum]